MKTSEKLARAMCNNIVGTDALWASFIPLITGISASILEELSSDEMISAAIEAYQETSEKIANKDGMRAAIKAIKEKVEEQAA
jgi:hypothetical protein